MAQSEMSRHPTRYSTIWDYVPGTVLKGFEHLWNFKGDTSYFIYIQNSINAVVNSSGKIVFGYTFLDYTLDGVNEGKAALFLYNQLGLQRYKIVVDTLRKQLSSHPRVSEGGFWHKKKYTNQMWLDGLYMGGPFYAEYGKVFSDTAAFTDVVKQFTLMESHARDSVTGLLYHGWDETKTAQWANPATGCSPSFWGRAIGWYAMGLVDALDYLPADHYGRAQLIGILQRLAVGIKNFQDSTYGTWYQVLDQGYRPDNWREASASCMFVYALAKGVRSGYLDPSYLAVAQKGYEGILNEFISEDGDGKIKLNGICLSAGLDAAPGGVRDGSYDYYVNNSGTQPVSNDGKGTGPFIMASVELEQIVTSVNNSGARISKFYLSQNYPNPFNPSTQIRFSVKERGWTTLKVYDILGREVAVLYQNDAEPFIQYTVQFESSYFSSGIYFSVLQQGSQRAGKKMLLVK